MKTTTMSIAVAGLIASGTILHAQDKRVSFDQLPWQVQHAFQKELGYEFNQEVTQKTLNGQTIYEALASKNGQTKTYQFTSGGQPYSPNVAVGAPAPATSGATPATTASGNTQVNNLKAVEFEKLPWQVQHAFQREAGYTFKGPVQQGNVGRQVIYQAQVTRDGQTRTLQFNNKGDALSVASTPAQAPAQSAVTYSEPLIAPERVELSGGTKVEFNQLPPDVQRIITTRAGGARIEDIDRGTAEGETVYQAAFKSSGQHIELQVAEDGTWIYDPRLAGTAPQASTPTAQATQPIHLSNSVKIQLSQAPQAVQQVIQQRSDGAQIEDLERGMWQGRPVYEAAFKSNGRHVELQVAEDGAVLHDPRMQGSAVGGPAAAESGTVSSQQMTKEEWKQMKAARKAQKQAEKEQRNLNRF